MEKIKRKNKSKKNRNRRKSEDFETALVYMHLSIFSMYPLRIPKFFLTNDFLQHNNALENRKSRVPIPDNFGLLYTPPR